jgi:hypothetical protein
VKDLTCSKFGVVRSCFVHGVWWFCQKTIRGGFLGLDLKLSSRVQGKGNEIQVQREASKRGTHGVITELASEGSKAMVDAFPLDEDTYSFPTLP